MTSQRKVLQVGISAYLETRDDWIAEVFSFYEGLNDHAIAHYRNRGAHDEPVFKLTVANPPNAIGRADRRYALPADQLSHLLFPETSTPGIGAIQASSLIQDAFFRVDERVGASHFFSGISPAAVIDEAHIASSELLGGNPGVETAVLDLVKESVISLLAHDGLRVDTQYVSSLVHEAVRLFRSHADSADWSGQTHRLDVEAMAEQFLNIEDESQALAFLKTYGPLHIDQPFRGYVKEIRLSEIIEHVTRHRNLLERGSVRLTDKEIRAISELTGPSKAPKKLTNFDSEVTQKSVAVAAEHLLNSADAYHAAPFFIEVRYETSPAANLACKTVEEGMRAFAFLSKLRGQEWAYCAHKHCNKLFQKRTKRSRKCGPKCISAATSGRWNDKHRPSVATVVKRNNC